MVVHAAVLRDFYARREQPWPELPYPARVFLTEKVFFTHRMLYLVQVGRGAAMLWLTIEKGEPGAGCPLALLAPEEDGRAGVAQSGLLI